MYWNASNASNPYITSFQMRISLLWQLSLLASRCWQNTFSLGRFLSICSFKQLWTPLLIYFSTKVKSRVFFKISNQSPSRQNRKLSRLPPPGRETLSSGSRCVRSHIFTVSHITDACFFCTTSGTTSSGSMVTVLFSHLLSLTCGLAMRIFYQEIEVGCSECWERQRISYSYCKGAHMPLNLVVTFTRHFCARLLCNILMDLFPSSLRNFLKVKHQHCEFCVGLWAGVTC